MLDRFKTHVSHTFPFLGKSKLLIACSGGVDSMVLAQLAKECNYTFSLAHCNYKLRGMASDLDEALVAKWAKENKVQFFSKTFDLTTGEGSIQLKARNLRYDWFMELMENKGFDHVLTAHHTDDSLETFFINLSRGTGLNGLTGIPGNNKGVLRPLLPFSKEEILSYAESNGILWREDDSNNEPKYLRNRVRHEIVPKLKEINPSFLHNFQKTQEYLSYSVAMLNDYRDVLRNTLFEQKGKDIHISILEIQKLNPQEAYLHLLFRSFGFTQWEDLKDLLETQTGKEICSKSHRIIKDREKLILTPLSQSIYGAFEINEGQKELKMPISLMIDEVDQLGEGMANTVYLDKEKLNYPLILRKWENGDYFYPLGMNGKKKLSKFFKDEKYSAIQKEEQWLLCSGADILWVLGKRMDDRFKVNRQTKEILKITWHI